MPRLLKRSLVFAALLTLPGCRPAATVVVVTSAGMGGAELPVARMPLVILPYDRDSVARALAAAGPPRPDTMAMVALLDSLRRTLVRIAQAPEASRPAARAAFTRLREDLTPRLDSLRQIQQAWRAQVYGGYDTLTLALTHRLTRDPFSDTTDARGAVLVRPRMSGPWWVTASTWDPADPYSEWYWNVPLMGDTVHLTSANAQRRTRI